MIFVGVSAAPCTQCNKQTNVRFMRTRQCLKYSIDCDVCVTLDALTSFLSASHVLGGAAFVLHYAAGQADRRAGGSLTTDAVRGRVPGE